MNDETQDAEQSPVAADCPNERLVTRKVANIAHHGGLLGFGDMHDALIEIRKLTLPWWDKEECSRLQRKIDA